MVEFIPAHKKPIDEQTRARLLEGESRHPMTFVERLAMPLLPAPEKGAPPRHLGAFFWHFASQIKGPLLLALFFKFLEVGADLMIPVALGTSSTSSRPRALRPWMSACSSCSNACLSS